MFASRTLDDCKRLQVGIPLASLISDTAPQRTPAPRRPSAIRGSAEAAAERQPEQTLLGQDEHCPDRARPCEQHEIVPSQNSHHYSLEKNDRSRPIHLLEPKKNNNRGDAHDAGRGIDGLTPAAPAGRRQGLVVPQGLRRAAGPGGASSGQRGWRAVARWRRRTRRP